MRRLHGCDIWLRLDLRFKASMVPALWSPLGSLECQMTIDVTSFNALNHVIYEMSSFLFMMAKRLGWVPLSVSWMPPALLVHFGKANLPGEPNSCCHCLPGDTLFELKSHYSSNTGTSPSDLFAVVVGSGVRRAAIVAFKERLRKVARTHTSRGSATFFF